MSAARILHGELQAPQAALEAIYGFLDARVELPSDPDECFGWSGYIGREGYAGITVKLARFNLGFAQITSCAHSFAYYRAKGPIPRGYEVDHRCQVRHCCNPRHLRILTKLDHRKLSRGTRKHCPNCLCPDRPQTHWRTIVANAKRRPKLARPNLCPSHPWYGGIHRPKMGRECDRCWSAYRAAH